MFGIELSDAKIHNFDYFAIDLKSDGNFIFNKKNFYLENLQKIYVTYQKNILLTY